MNKLFTAALVVLIAGFGWYLYQPTTGSSAVSPQSAPSTGIAASSDAAGQAKQISTAAKKRTAELSPYANCPATGAHPVDIQQQLTEQLLPLLSNGKTPAQLLRYDMHGAIWYMAYAESIAQAMQIKGSKTLNIQEPSVLDMLADRVQQELSGSPEEFARVLATDEDFQVFVPMEFGTWGGSAYLSPSLLFLQLGDKIPAAEFKRLIAGKTFSPLEIAVAMQSRLPTEQLLQLLTQGRDLDQFPAGYHSYQTRTPAWNLADIAAMHWQPAVLKALKQQGVVPSTIEGVVTGLDFAMFTEPSHHLELEKNPELQSQLKQAQRDTVAYLLEEGYWAHGYQREDGDWSFGNNFLNAGRFVSDDILALLPAGAQDKVFRRVELQPQPIPAGTALADWVAQQKLAEVQAKQAQQQCLTGKAQFLNKEALLNREGIQEQIFSWREGKPLTELALSPLHQRDPAWVAWHWQMGGELQLDANPTLKDKLAGLLNNPTELMAFLQKTELDSGTTAWLLMEVMTKPALVSAFEQRFAPKAPAYLSPGYGFNPERDLKALQEAGFDLGVKDLYGRNLFNWAFKVSPETVQFLISQGLSPFAQELGSDALDLALEDSYLQDQLHPALPLILQQLTDPEPSHLSRLKRLALYRPELYQAVLKLKPDLQLPADTKPNELLSPPQMY